MSHSGLVPGSAEGTGIEASPTTHVVLFSCSALLDTVFAHSRVNYVAKGNRAAEGLETRLLQHRIFEQQFPSTRSARFKGLLHRK